MVIWRSRAGIGETPLPQERRGAAGPGRIELYTARVEIPRVGGTSLREDGSRL
jgi:hypothetical protein